jgi:lysophospholipase L1-like esterase
MIGGGPGLGIFDGAVLGLGVVTALAALLPMKLTANYVIVFCAGMLTLLATELVLRATLRPHYFSANDFDDRVLFKPTPNAASAFTHLPVNGGETIVTRFNSQGYAGPDLLAPGTRPRIVVYGDSFTNALFTPQDQRLTSQLQTLLNDQMGREVEVINAGIAGYGPDQVLRRMQDELEVLTPDLVIFNLFSGNDFGDLLRNRLYRLDDTGALVENDYVLSKQQQLNIELNRHELVLLRVLKDAKDRLTGAGDGAGGGFDAEGWITRAYDQHLREYDEFIVQGDNTVGSFASDPYSTDIAVDPTSPSSQYKIRMMEQIIAQIADVARAADVPVLATVIPHPMDLLAGDHSSGRINPDTFPGYVPTSLSGTAAGIFSDLEIAHIDLYPAFAAQDANALYLKGGDDHWNAAGQALAAEILAERIVADGLLK